MFRWNENGELVVVDKVALDNWLNFKAIHNNPLSIDSEIVEKVIDRFPEVSPMKIYPHLKMIYQTRFETYEEFENGIERNLSATNSFNELADTLIVN